jgi:hypothetical protein
MWYCGLAKNETTQARMRAAARVARGPGPGPLLLLGCRMLSWHPALQFDLSEEVSSSIQMKIDYPKQKAFKIFLGKN